MGKLLASQDGTKDVTLFADVCLAGGRNIGRRAQVPIAERPNDRAKGKTHNVGIAPIPGEDWMEMRVLYGIGSGLVQGVATANIGIHLCRVIVTHIHHGLGQLADGLSITHERHPRKYLVRASPQTIQHEARLLPVGRLAEHLAF